MYQRWWLFYIFFPQYSCVRSGSTKFDVNGKALFTTSGSDFAWRILYIVILSEVLLRKVNFKIDVIDRNDIPAWPQTDLMLWFTDANQFWGPELLVIPAGRFTSTMFKVSSLQIVNDWKYKWTENFRHPFKFNFKNVFFWNIITETRERKF